MSLEVLIVLIALTAAGYWFFVRPRGAAKRNQPRSSPPASLAPEVTPTPRTEEDTFLTEITRAKAALESAASSAGAEQARELDAKFGADIALKEQLSKFALESGLDDALIALWDEVKYYPSWSQREDFTKWNKLALSGIAGSKENDTESVAFAGPSSHYRIAKRGWIGLEWKGILMRISPSLRTTRRCLPYVARLTMETTARLSVATTSMRYVSAAIGQRTCLLFTKRFGSKPSARAQVFVITGQRTSESASKSSG